MGIKFQFPSPLDVGHCIAIVGEVGRKRFILKLQSDFKAFNPDVLLNSSTSDSLESPSPTLNGEQFDSRVPVGDTHPLEVSLDTNGEWEVCGSTPETSSNASGFSATRNGFRSGELFTVKIYVKMDFFEVHLNNVCLSLSEHMIPVSCIQSIVIEGDCRISKMYFGDNIAVEKSVRQAVLHPLPPRAPSLKNLTQLNLEEASIIECTRREPSVDISDVSLDPNFKESLFAEDEKVAANKWKGKTSSNEDISNIGSFVPFFRSLTSLHRAESYQLVFDVSDEEDDSIDLSSHFPVKRASSCFNLHSNSPPVIKRPSLILPPKPVPQRHLNLQNLLPLTDNAGKIKRPVRNPQATKNQGPSKPLMARTGYTIKVTHPVIQMGVYDSPAKTSIPRPTAALLSAPPPLLSTLTRPTKDDQTSLRLPDVAPAHHMKQVGSESAIRRRSIPLSIR